MDLLLLTADAVASQNTGWVPWAIAAASAAAATVAVLTRPQPLPPPPLSRPPADDPTTLEDLSLKTLMLESSTGRIEQTLAQVIDSSGKIVYFTPAWAEFVEDTELDPRLALLGEDLPSLLSDPAGLLGDAAILATRSLSDVLHRKSPSLRIDYRVSTASMSAAIVLSIVRCGDAPDALTVVTHTPATDRLRLNTLLRESERRYRLLFRLSPLPMLVVSASDGIILAANEAAGELLLSEPDAIEGRALSTLMAAHSRSATPTPAALPSTTTLRRSDGAPVTTELHHANLGFEGSPARLIVLRDVSAQVVAQQAARLRECMLAAVARAGEWLVQESDWHAGLRSTLPELARASLASRVLVYQTVDLPAPQPISSHHETPPHSSLDDSIAKALSGDLLTTLKSGHGAENTRIELASGLHCATAAIAPVMVGDMLWGFIALVRDEDSRPFGAAENDSLRSFAGMLGSTIRRNQIQDALRRADDQARHTQKLEALGQLAEGISHDFNNLLTAIHGYITLAKGSLPFGHPATHSLEQVESAATQAGGMANSLLTFARRSKGDRKLMPLATILEPAIRLVRRTMPANITIESSCEDAANSWVTGDPGQIQQVIVAIALNAKDAMPHGGLLRFRTGSATGRDGQPWATISIEDNGIGMPPEVLRRAFEPFFTTKPRSEATGLGLSIAHSIINQHGGTIDAESSPGAGSTFLIRLPASTPPRPEPALNEPKAAPMYMGTALVVEDHQLVGALVSTALASMGYSPAQVLTVAEGDAELVNRPAVLVVDIQLPDANGIEWVRSLRAKGLTTPVLFISGRSDEEIDDPALSPAMILHKPFQIGELTRLLGDLLRDNRVEVDS